MEPIRASRILGDQGERHDETLGYHQRGFIRGAVAECECGPRRIVFATTAALRDSGFGEIRHVAMVLASRLRAALHEHARRRQER